MGTSKPAKKTKIMKRRGRVVVDDEESGELAKSSILNNGFNVTDMKEDDVAVTEVKAHKSKKLRRVKKKVPAVSKEQGSEVNNVEESEPVAADHSRGKKDKSNKGLKRRKDTPVSAVQSAVVSSGDEIEPVIQEFSDSKKDKLKRARKNRKKGTLLSDKQIAVNNGEEEFSPDARVLSKKTKGKSKKAERNLVLEKEEVAIYDVYQISSGEDDESKGMKKWIKEYHERRPGLKVLQERIDEFITAYDEREEQAKRDREAQLADDGWTVVVHRKGGKKTTDSDSGVAVGSVAEAAVRDKMAKKKSKDVGLDFYRFQRKEAHRSEIMKLQSKFEEDKKRIQQIRAARKFRPY